MDSHSVSSSRENFNFTGGFQEQSGTTALLTQQKATTELFVQKIEQLHFFQIHKKMHKFDSCASFKCTRRCTSSHAWGSFNAQEGTMLQKPAFLHLFPISDDLNLQIPAKIHVFFHDYTISCSLEKIFLYFCRLSSKLFVFEG